MEALLRDIRHALRSLTRRPLFALVAGGSLALGIGANTALFTVVETVLLRPVPGVGEPKRTVELGRGRRGDGFDTFSYPDFADLRAGVPALAELAAWRADEVSLSRGGAGERVNAMFVTPSYFRALGLTPSVGRFFTPDEDAGPDAHPVAVLGHAYWRERFGADPSVVGATLLLDRQQYTVVGIAPETFPGHVIGFVPPVYLPMMQDPIMHEGRNLFASRRSSWLQVIGRMAPDASLDQLNAQLESVAARLAKAYPESNEDRTFRAMPLGLVPGGGRTPVAVFLGALTAMAGLILLVTCTNVAGMFLARAAGREREVAIRVALGSGRATLVRSLTVETLAVFALGGGAGLLLARWAVGLLRPDLLPTPVSLEFAFTPDGRVLAVALLATFGTGLVFGLLPALAATRVDLLRSLRHDARAGARTGRLRRAFVAAQIGFSLVLLTTAALFLRSLQQAADVETGIDASGTYMTRMDLSIEGYDREQGSAFQRRLLERIRTLPGVEAAGFASDLPLDMGRSETTVRPEGWTSPNPDGGGLRVEFSQVSDGYFEALRIALLRGRGLGPEDGPSAPRVAVVSRAFAAVVWPDAEPLGRRFIYEGEPFTVVGVAQDVKNAMITDRPAAFVYLPVFQVFDPSTNLIVRASGGIEQVAPLLRDAILQADPRLSVAPVISLERYTSMGTLPQRVAAGVATGLGALALLLSGLGIYGVVAYSVSQRTRELGIRMALGATASELVTMVLRGGAGLALPGLAVGAVAALAVGYLLRSLLLGLSPVDPLALGTVTVSMCACVALASGIPAWRASRVDPVRALHSD